MHMQRLDIVGIWLRLKREGYTVRAYRFRLKVICREDVSIFVDHQQIYSSLLVVKGRLGQEIDNAPNE